MSSTRLAILLLVAATQMACVAQPTLEGKALEILDQSRHAQRDPSKTRVLFFNDTNKGLWLLTHQIIISLDGNVTPSIPTGKYFQIDLEKGEYDLVLRHWDLINFTDEYNLDIHGDFVFIRVFNTLAHTEYEIVDSLPASFEKEFDPLAESL